MNYPGKTTVEWLLNGSIYLAIVTGLWNSWTFFWRVMGPRPDNKTVELPIWQDPPWSLWMLVWSVVVVVACCVWEFRAKEKEMTK